MSERGNVLFFNEEDNSVIVSSYWGGLGFVTVAIYYAVVLKSEVDTFRQLNPNQSTPLSRLEPDLIVVDFIRHLHDSGWIKSTERDSDIYLYKSEKEVSGKIYKLDLNSPSKLLDSGDIKHFWERR